MGLVRFVDRVDSVSSNQPTNQSTPFRLQPFFFWALSPLRRRQLHFRTDAPIELKSLFFFPSYHTEKFGMARMEPGVSLYSRKVKTDEFVAVFCYM